MGSDANPGVTRDSVTAIFKVHDGHNLLRINISQN